MKINRKLPTPYYLIDETVLRHNLEIVQSIKARTGCKFLLAQKAFSSFYFYPLMKAYLDGTTASGLYEARLGYEEFGGEVHVYAPAFKDEDFVQILKYADHIVFNSITQLKKYKNLALSHHKTIGLRINPEISTQNHAMYDPCSPTSRMGVRLSDFDESVLPYISGLHFHTLCQQNADALKTTLQEVERKFGAYLHQLKWLNFGGGHHITRTDYDVDLLVDLINYYQTTYNLQIYLEPGEGLVLNAGYLVAQVLDIVHNDMPIAILDTSATCHMPDVIEMPFTPPVVGAIEKSNHHYRLSGFTCLTGDNIGQYYFPQALQVGDIIIFEDMALYTIVKNNTFNGIPLPAIYARKENGEDRLVKAFGYEDFKRKLS
ncbi:MAG: carboxynorspermidine decarboxylase [Bacilli bacterium]